MNKKKAMSRNLVIYTLLLIALLTAIFLLAKAGDSSGNATFNQAPPLDNQPVLGNPQAPVAIVEFGDYKCPACKQWHETILPQLKKDYIDTGKVKYSFINVLFHGEESKIASLAAESVFAQNKDAFWEYHDRLFASQSADHSAQQPMTVDFLMNVAQSEITEIDAEKLKRDIENEAAMPQLMEDEKLIETYRINETPSIFVGNVLLKDPFSYDHLVEIIEEKLGEQQS